MNENLGITETGQGEVGGASPQQPTTADALAQVLKEERALIQELQWAYKRISSLEKLETVLENVREELSESRRMQSVNAELIDQRLRKQHSTLRRIRQEEGSGVLPAEFPSRFERLSKRTQRIEKELQSVSYTLSSMEAKLETLPESIGIKPTIDSVES